MPWRYFYSTEESDTALKAILSGQDYVSGNALVKGVYEYKVAIDNDDDFRVLANKIALGGIRAIASPERTSQFGNIQSDNFMDSTVYAAGCSYRMTDAISKVLLFLQSLSQSMNFAQRDLDMQGTASLGTIALTLSSKYSKTYNVPVNGSVSDRTLVKAVRDSTAPACTETNATLNNAMFDFQDPHDPSASWQSIEYSHAQGGSTFEAKMKDRKLDVDTSQYVVSDNGVTRYFILDYGGVMTAKNIHIIGDFSIYGAGTRSYRILISSDKVTWTDIGSGQPGNATYNKISFTNKTFRYIKFQLESEVGGNWIRWDSREFIVNSYP